VEVKMLAATHMLAGATAYIVVKRKKWIGLPLAFGSHFLLDRMHHYDLNIAWNFGCRCSKIILFLMLYLGTKQRDIFLVIAAFLGALPDIISILHISEAFHRVHMYLHFDPVYPLPYYLWFIEQKS
jgi:hypothetical protein